jgi:hypothetical protein
MRKGWKRVAEWADKVAFEPDQIAQIIPQALEEDWREESCDEAVRILKDALGDPRQGSLFEAEKIAGLEDLRKTAGVGSPLRRLVVDCVIQAASEGQADPLLEGTKNALTIRSGSCARSVEEHYRRRTNDNRSVSVRTRMESGIERTPLDNVAQRLAKIGTPTASQQPVKQQGLDDGVRL